MVNHWVSTDVDERSKRKYRPELQGIRAVAAVLVAIYHIWFGRVSGGVDVFFVVSAFLIFGSLSRSVEKSGTVDVLSFYARLIKRLIPAALVVIVAVVLISIFVLPQIRWAHTIREVLAATFYVENWLLAFSSIDYLARDDPQSPLQHYWALSAQAQFYLVCPFFLLFVAWLAKLFKQSYSRVLMFALIAVFCLSLCYSIYLTNVNQPFAYFSTFTRLWEFAIGGLLWLLLPRIKWSNNVAGAASWIGLLAIVACGAALQVSNIFPGFAALWPTLAAATIIAAGDRRSNWGANRILSTKLLTGIGDISYGFYLWHWPILIFYRVHYDVSDIGVVAGLAIIFGALALAWVTTKAIENPIRYSEIGAKQRRSAFLLGAAGCGGVMLVVAVWAGLLSHARTFDQRSISVEDPNYPGARAVDAGKLDESAYQVPYYPGPLAVGSDLPDYVRQGCHPLPTSAEPVSCTYGDQDSAVTLAIVGGSHTGQWIPALRLIADDYRWRIVTFIKRGCKFSTERQFDVVGSYSVSCQPWNESVVQRLLSLQPQAVFTTATAGHGSSEHVPKGFIDQWQKLDDAEISVVAVRDNPRMNFRVAECVEMHSLGSRSCVRSREKIFATNDPLSSAPISGRVHLIDLSEYFCPLDDCLPIIGNVVVYRDKHHLTSAYSKTLADPLARKLMHVMPREFFASEP